MRVQIQCIVKSDRYNPHERILAVGGRNANGSAWQLSQEEAIRGIETRQYSFFVRVGNREVDVIIAISQYGHKYLKTIADGVEPNNLLSLAQCPV